MINKIRSHLVSNAESILRSPIHFLPKSVQNKTVVTVLNKVFEESIEDGELDFLEGNWLHIKVLGLGVTIPVSFDGAKLITQEFTTQADVTFSANLNDLVLIAGRKEDPDTLFFQRRLLIQGDTELGLELKNLLDGFDFDTLPKPVSTPALWLAEFVEKGMKVAHP